MRNKKIIPVTMLSLMIVTTNIINVNSIQAQKDIKISTFIKDQSNEKLKGSNITLGEVTDYSDDIMLSQYVPTAVNPLKPYRYNSVLNNNYPIYSQLTNGQSDTENIVDSKFEIGTTLYNDSTMQVTYTSGEKTGRTATFVHVSMDGKTWYWIDEHALNLDLSSTYPSENSNGIALPDGMFLGTTITYGNENMPVNTQMISNSYNENGQIIYKCTATEDNFKEYEDPAYALQMFRENFDRAIKSWNDAIDKDKPTFINADTTDEAMTHVIGVGDPNNGSATSLGVTRIDPNLVKWALDPNSSDYDINMLFITIRHELGHALGLDHTSGGQYYGMPDNYRLGIDDDVMNAILVHTSGGYPWTQKTITNRDVMAIKLMLNNNNFGNPRPSIDTQVDKQTPTLRIIEKNSI
ncbi:hypothetical protein RD055328_06830 [Companilactobacillus sp. RD055328]|uniref:hypothetical protein n=1 Tax=Companilactobacillus sp. RD055328 TaxID=2916634 RepID=UPI001FC8B88B|nr:hypothetical protein [Companilactobacillus sp. RD055328]GKQ42760.1 hypothetical protein RD055328_06830 [Companilactobacillus sp. RD055328]